MTAQQRAANVNFFNMMIQITNEGGTYTWPDANETFIIKNGKMIGSKSGIRKVKEITTFNFHKKLVVK